VCASSHSPWYDLDNFFSEIDKKPIKYDRELLLLRTTLCFPEFDRILHEMLVLWEESGFVDEGRVCLEAEREERMLKEELEREGEKRG